MFCTSRRQPNVICMIIFLEVKGFFRCCKPLSQQQLCYYDLSDSLKSREVLSVYLVGWPGWLRAAAAAAATASAAKRSSQSTAHDVAYGRAHSHTSGSGGHLSHEARTLGRCRGRGQSRGRWVCRRRRVCRSCRAKHTKQPQRVDVNQRFGAIRIKIQ